MAMWKYEGKLCGREQISSWVFSNFYNAIILLFHVIYEIFQTPFPSFSRLDIINLAKMLQTIKLCDLQMFVEFSRHQVTFSTSKCATWKIFETWNEILIKSMSREIDFHIEIFY